MAGFVLANIVGVSIMLFGLRAYRDVGAVFSDPGGAIAGNHIVISPSVSGSRAARAASGVAGARRAGFSEDEIEALGSHGGVERLGRFRSCDFEVTGSLSILGYSISTLMFVESVPDSFLDVDLTDWKAGLDSDMIPVIVPRQYLNVYNFGFASAMQMPQIGEDLISNVVFTLQFSGNGALGSFRARIVGLTDRLNSILVPDSFLEEANKVYGSPAGSGRVGRLIIKPDGSDDDALLSYIHEKGYTFDGTGADSLKVVSLARGVAGFVVLQGVIISLLAFFLLVVSIHLLIEKNRKKNSDLLALGCTRREVCLPYIVCAAALDFVSLAIAVLSTALGYPAMVRVLRNFNPEFSVTGVGFTVLVASGLLVFFTLLHYLLIRHEVRES